MWKPLCNACVTLCANLEGIDPVGYILFQSCDFRIDVVEGLSFATRGNIVEEAGQVVDEFVVDHIRETLEFEKQVRPYTLDSGDFPEVIFPLVFVPSILTRYELAEFSEQHD